MIHIAIISVSLKLISKRGKGYDVIMVLIIPLSKEGQDITRAMLVRKMAVRF